MANTGLQMMYPYRRARIGGRHRISSSSKEPSPHEKEFLKAANHGVEKAKQVYNQHKDEIDINVADKNHDDNTALIKATMSDKIDFVNWMLTLPGINVNQKNRNDHTALSWACRKCNLKMAEALLSHGANPTDWYALNANMIEGSRRIMSLMMKRGADLNITDHKQDTLLMNAVREDNLEFVTFLIDYKPNVNAVNKYGQTALLLACWYKHDRLIQYLLDHGAKQSINAQDWNGDTAATIAASHSMDATMLLLVQHGANLHLQNIVGKSAFDLFKAKNSGYFQKVFREYIMQGEVEKAKSTYRQGKELIDFSCFTPGNCESLLAMAAKYDQAQMVAWLLDEVHVNVNEKDRQGTTALMVAADNGYIEVVRVLLNHGAIVDDRDKHKQTALMKASPWKLKRSRHILFTKPQGCDDVAKALLQRGARVDFKNDVGETALHIAVRDHQANVDVLLKHDASPNDIYPDGNTLVMVACEMGNISIAVSLLAHGAGKTINHQNREGDTALICAARNGIDALLPLVATQGAMMDHRNSEGCTALMCASLPSSTKILLKQGANPYSRDLSGASALKLASHDLNNRERAVQLLVGESQCIPWDSMTFIS